MASVVSAPRGRHLALTAILLVVAVSLSTTGISASPGLVVQDVTPAISSAGNQPPGLQVVGQGDRIGQSPTSTPSPSPGHHPSIWLRVLLVVIGATIVLVALITGRPERVIGQSRRGPASIRSRRRSSSTL